MKAAFRNPDILQCPKKVKPYVGNLFFTPNQEYDIQAVVVFEGITFFLLITDVDIPGYWPAWLFTVTDSSIPPDWICTSRLDWPELLIGPSFLTESQEAHIKMAEHDPDQIARLRQRIKKDNET